MSIHVTSEVSPLKKVLVHRPGPELERLAPGDLERLLFDDIPYLTAARKEHDRFAGLMREHGVEVVYLEDLMADVLRLDSDIKRRFVFRFIEEGGPAARRYHEPLTEYLLSLPDELTLVRKTMCGVSASELHMELHAPLTDLLRPQNRFLLDPIPNLYFTRDAFAVLGEGVSLHRMLSVTRQRETIYGEYILRYHPAMSKDIPLYYRRSDPFNLEGGDLVNLSERVLAVGISQRTSPEGVELLAQNLFSDERSPVDTVLAFDIPSKRAFMHLDTVFTQVDNDTFIVHPGILDSLRLFRITPGTKSEPLRVRELREPLDRVLADALGLDRVVLLKCGGGDRIAAEREQWSDGSNTLCLSPGTVIVYDRNSVSNELLREHGVTVLEMPSSELSRGRGGPHCMSMPLVRA